MMHLGGLEGQVGSQGPHGQRSGRPLMMIPQCRQRSSTQCCDSVKRHARGPLTQWLLPNQMAGRICDITTPRSSWLQHSRRRPRQLCTLLPLILSQSPITPAMQLTSPQWHRAHRRQYQCCHRGLLPPVLRRLHAALVGTHTSRPWQCRWVDEATERPQFGSSFMRWVCKGSSAPSLSSGDLPPSLKAFLIACPLCSGFVIIEAINRGPHLRMHVPRPHVYQGG